MTGKKEKGPFVGGLQLQQKTLKLIQQAMSSDKILLSLVEIFTALADPTRLKIIQALSLKELRVCDLALSYWPIYFGNFSSIATSPPPSLGEIQKRR